MVEAQPEQSIKKALKQSPAGLHIAALALKTGLSRTTISKYVAVMEERGDLEIERIGSAKRARWTGPT